MSLESKLFYLATPYAKYLGGLDKATDDAAMMSGILLTAGINVYSPIVHCHPISRLLTNQTYEEFKRTRKWLQLDFNMIERLDGMIICKAMQGWDQSSGIADEIEFCNAVIFLPVFDFTGDVPLLKSQLEERFPF